MPVTIQYKTTYGSTWDTYERAEIADILEQNVCYLEAYKLKAIVEALAPTPPTNPEDNPNETN